MRSQFLHFNTYIHCTICYGSFSLFLGLKVTYVHFMRTYLHGRKCLLNVGHIASLDRLRQALSGGGGGTPTPFFLLKFWVNFPDTG